MTAFRLGTMLASLLLPASQLVAQEVVARAVLAAPRSSVRVGQLTERVAGLWGGVVVDFHMGPVGLTASGARGRLTPAAQQPVLERAAGEMTATGRYDVTPWLGMEAGYAARAFRSAAGRERWDIVGVGVNVAHRLGTDGSRAYARVSYLPLVKVSGEERPRFAVGTEVGIALVTNRSPITFAFSYRVERFRFEQGAARSDQFEALTLSMGARVLRFNGR